MDSSNMFASGEKTAKKSLEYCFPRAFIQGNSPTFVTYALGTAVLVLFCLAGAAIYATYCIASTVAMWATVCVNCPYYGRVCPCGYSTTASSLFKKGKESTLRSRYRLIWLYIAPAWLIPPIAAAPVLCAQFSWLLLVLLVAFLTMAFVVAPTLTRVAGCCEYWRGVPESYSTSGVGDIKREASP